MLEDPKFRPDANDTTTARKVLAIALAEYANELTAGDYTDPVRSTSIRWAQITMAEADALVDRAWKRMLDRCRG
jgi:hypothetical protein